MVDWYQEVRTAGNRVEAWIQVIDPAGWAAPQGAAWNNKDLLGHLAAWSNLLVDQLEALVREPCHSVAVVDVHAWNAEQVAMRRARAPREIVEEWRRSFCRALTVVQALPPEAYVRSAPVAWTEEPVSAGHILALWVSHVDQHGARLELPS